MKKISFKNLVTLLELDPDIINSLLEIAIQEKQRFVKKGPNDMLKGKTSILFFEKPSLRTRVTFEVAMAHVGGSTINLEPSSVSLGKRESVSDAALNLSRWVDAIIARTFKQSLVEELACYSSRPVINALTDKYHPCQALAFAQTFIENRGKLKGARLVFVGDGNNVANSLAILCAFMGMHFTLACPPGYEQSEGLQQLLRPIYEKNGMIYSIHHDPVTAVAEADAIYTDVWVSMGEEKKREDKKRHFAGYQVNLELLSHAPADCIVSHCLPAHRGEEITDQVMDSSKAICFEEAENRLHIQKAVLLSLLHPDYTL